jgi:hypothetical protein
MRLVFKRFLDTLHNCLVVGTYPLHKAPSEQTFDQ